MPQSKTSRAAPTQVKGDPEQHGGARDSAAKLAAAHDLCRGLGVHTEPLRLGRLWIVPVLSWHHKVGLLGLRLGAALRTSGGNGRGACARVRSALAVGMLRRRSVT